MRCYFHHDQEAVGLCRVCARGICPDCLMELATGLVCRGRCEERAKEWDQFNDHALEASKGATKAALVVPAVVHRSAQPVDYVAAQLTSHVQQTLNLRRTLGGFCVVVGLVLVLGGFPDRILALMVAGSCFVGFGLVCLVQAKRISTRPKLPTTQTR